MMREGWEIHCPIEFVPYYDVLKGSNNILLDNSGEYCATMRIKYYKYPKVISI
ncbi:MAG: hypothetical protein GTO02_00635 [Candidatus Dadabacteria bacterium]|nr:hypothetical protein [Candidatus Dadabacteria bacterium]